MSTDLSESTPIAEPTSTLAEIVMRIPTEPGVYLMRDHHGKIIYVGKAQNLRQRVKSYFSPSGDERRFVHLLERLVGDIETIVTTNEKEALLLENNLIKQHRPRFNIKLIDDKNYLVLRLDTKADYPRLEVTRKIQEDSAKYFGPYHSASSCRQTLEVINRHFKLRTCTDQMMANRKRPCLQYQIKRCDAPCVFPIPKQEYADQVRDVSLFLEGKDTEVITRLKDRMQKAVQAMEYEVAAALRDQIQSLQKTLEKQQVVSPNFVDQDIFGYYRQGDQLEIAVLQIRQGKMQGQRTYHFKDQEFPDEEALSSFVNLYYDLVNFVPQEIILPLALEDVHAKIEWLETLAERLGTPHRVSIYMPQRGARQKLLELANKNAQAAFVSRRNKQVDTEELLIKLQRRLHLNKIPRKIECFDISHLQGTNTVASRVVFVNAEPARNQYRVFTIQSAKNDDFASMYEAVSRRLRHAKKIIENPDAETDKAWALPDLIVIDGGKGQLSSALAALKDVGFSLADVDMVGLAKEREETDENSPEEKQPDRVFLPKTKDPIRLRKNTSELFVLSRIRDEAHRFAITFHKKKRAKRTVKSVLSEIPGIGPTKQKALLHTFGSVKKIAMASVEELTQVSGITTTLANQIKENLKS